MATAKQVRDEAQRIIERWADDKTKLTVTVNGIVCTSISAYILSAALGMVLCSTGDPGSRPLLIFSFKPDNYDRIKIVRKNCLQIQFYRKDFGADPEVFVGEALEYSEQGELISKSARLG